MSSILESSAEALEERANRKCVGQEALDATAPLAGDLIKSPAPLLIDHFDKVGSRMHD